MVAVCMMTDRVILYLRLAGVYIGRWLSGHAWHYTLGVCLPEIFSVFIYTPWHCISLCSSTCMSVPAYAHQHVLCLHVNHNKQPVCVCSQDCTSILRYTCPVWESVSVCLDKHDVGHLTASYTCLRLQDWPCVHFHSEVVGKPSNQYLLLWVPGEPAHISVFAYMRLNVPSCVPHKVVVRSWFVYLSEATPLS